MSETRSFFSKPLTRWAMAGAATVLAATPTPAEVRKVRRFIEVSQSSFSSFDRTTPPPAPLEGDRSAATHAPPRTSFRCPGSTHEK